MGMILIKPMYVNLVPSYAENCATIKIGIRRHRVKCGCWIVEIMQ